MNMLYSDNVFGFLAFPAVSICIYYVSQLSNILTNVNLIKKIIEATDIWKGKG